MKLLDRLQRSLRPYAIANLTLYLVGIQAFMFFVCLQRPDIAQRMILDHDRLFAGEWWRLFSIILIPPAAGNVLFAAMALYFFYWMGTLLEQNWGTVRYNLYLVVGYLATVMTALIPHTQVGNAFLMGSVLIAFAWLYPDLQILLFSLSR